MPFVSKCGQNVRNEVRFWLAHLADRASVRYPFKPIIPIVGKPVRWLMHKEKCDRSIDRRGYKWCRCDGLFLYNNSNSEIVIACHDTVSINQINWAVWHEIRHAKQWLAGLEVDENGVDRDSIVEATDFALWMQQINWRKVICANKQT